MKFYQAKFVFLISSIMAGCSSGPSESEFAPKIGQIETTITHTHPSAHQHLTSAEQRTISFTIRVSITDPDGLGDITTVYIRDKSHNSYWILKDHSELNENADCIQSDEIITCTFYSSERPDEIELSGYELVAADLHTYQTSKEFEFKLPAGDLIDNEEFVYSATYTGGTPNGIPALEAMNEVDNALVFNVDFDAEIMHVKFETTDDRAKHYGISLYDSTADKSLVGKVVYDSVAISNNPIVFGEKTILDIPFSNISFETGYDQEDIYGAHIVLLDTPVDSDQLEVESKWFNYSGFSELLTL